MKIYSFYKRLDNLYTKDSIVDHEKVLEVWKKSWSYYGWEPVVLSMNDIPIDDNFIKIYQNMKNLPCENSFKYESLCYFRWLAMQGKSGWFCDYDMINYGFKPCEFENKVATLAKVKRLGASVIYGPVELYENIASEILNFNFENFKQRQGAKTFYHISDMIILNSLFKADISLGVMTNDSDPNYLVNHYYWNRYGNTKYEAILKDPRSKVFL